MRKVLGVAAIIAVGTILLACARRPPEQIAPPPPVAYDQSEDYAPGPDGYAMPRAPYGRSSYDHAQLPPPPGYVPPPPGGYVTGPAPYGRSSYAQGAPPPRPPAPYGRSSYAQSVAPRDIRPPAPMNTPPPPPPYGRSPSAQNGGPQQDARLEWRASPRWATANAAKKKPSAPKPDPEAKFKAAEAKAAEVGVENLTQEDIAGLSAEQITQLRGY